VLFKKKQKECVIPFYHVECFFAQFLGFLEKKFNILKQILKIEFFKV